MEPTIFKHFSKYSPSEACPKHTINGVINNGVHDIMYEQAMVSIQQHKLLNQIINRMILYYTKYQTKQRMEQLHTTHIL
jgi:hypothetical protein